MPELKDDLFDGDEGDGSEGDGAPDGDPSKKDKDPKSTEKRISDLQSAKDKETARANKLQKQLDAIVLASKDDDAEGGKAPAASAGTDAATNAILEMAKMFAVQQHPKLSEFGLSASDLTGSTPGEIAQSAAALVARFEKIETQVKNKVLADNGLAPEIEAGTPTPTKARDFTNMSKEDFKKVMDAALAGRT